MNHSRWIADCPNGDRGALLVEPGQPLMCPYCCNADIDGRWRQVIWPEARAEIEAALERRLFVHHRSWDRDYSLDDVLAENLSGAVPVRA